MTKILIVDDDAHIREVLAFALDAAGYSVAEAANGIQALERFKEEQPALVILDVMMPEMDGTEVCRQLRLNSMVPIIFLTSKDEEIDRIVGLELGADDYVTKPFSPRELVARVRANLRRAQQQPMVSGEHHSVKQHGKLKLDLDRVAAFWDDQEVELTSTEFGILRTLIQYPGKVYGRNELMQQAYNDHRYVSDRTIDSHVRRVRAKFAEKGGDPVETVHGAGYKLSNC
jgi:two-component system OmpR family response regulator